MNNNIREDQERYEWRKKTLHRGLRRHAYDNQDAEERPLHVVCVSDEAESVRALRFALRNLPLQHRLVLVHGHYNSRLPDALVGHDDSEEVRRRFLRMCQRDGKECKYASFDYRSNRDFGSKVCSLAKSINAQSVIVGKRESVSDARRAVMGSSSASLLSWCGLPVTVVQSERNVE